MRMFLFVFICFMLAATASATHVAVLETGADGSAKEMVSLTDRQYLTNVLREQAVKELPATQNYTIMTRENIQQMLPPGKAIEDCEGSCLVETGKNISADFICQVRVGSFAGELTLSAELYETAGNKLVASFNGQGANLKELLELVKQKSPEFFRIVKEMSQPAPVVQEIPASIDTVEAVVSEPESRPDTVATQANEPDNSDSVRVLAKDAYNELDGKNKVGESVPTNVDAAEPSKIHWLPLGISAAATVTGVVLAVVGNSQAKKAADKGGDTVRELEKNRDDAESGQTIRAVGVGLAIVGAIGVCLSFAF